MTKQEAEKKLLAYREKDNDGRLFGFTIISYEGADRYGNHFFRCAAEGTATRDDKKLPILAVAEDVGVMIVPT